VDCDCEFVARPELIMKLAGSKCDFAIYNWLADDYTDFFKPIEISKNGENVPSNRFYRYNGSVEWYSSTQLVCSGLVQFYRDSFAARNLLSQWQRTIMEFPESADDQCLDFTHNNLSKCSLLYWTLRTRWLPKAYARIGFWIYVEPVINHAELPTEFIFAPINDPRGRQRRYQSGLSRKKGTCPIPRDCIVDTANGVLLRQVDGKWVASERTELKFWV